MKSKCGVVFCSFWFDPKLNRTLKYIQPFEYEVCKQRNQEKEDDRLENSCMFCHKLPTTLYPQLFK